MTTQDLVEHLRKRVYEIGVQGDLITDDLLEEAAECIEGQTNILRKLMIANEQYRKNLEVE